MEKLESYFKLQNEIFDYFGYVEDRVVIPIDSQTDMYWFLNTKEDSVADEVVFAKVEEDFLTGKHYVHEIYKQRFLPKWVYRGEDYTMIVVNTNVDGNKFLQIFDNSKELTGTERDLIESKMR